MEGIANRSGGEGTNMGVVGRQVRGAWMGGDRSETLLGDRFIIEYREGRLKLKLEIGELRNKEGKRGREEEARNSKGEGEACA